MITAWKGDLTSPDWNLAGTVKNTRPSVKKSTPKVNFSSPDRPFLISQARERLLRNAPVKSSLITGTGTVVYVELEGGFFGIIADDGTHYLPDNLPESCRVDGLLVKFTGIERAPAPNIRMWGTSLRILSATPLGKEVKTEGCVKFIELEGGFYGIITTDGTFYLPLNLPEKYQVDGLEVSFTARTAPDTATIQMWGIPVTIVSISRRSTSIESGETSLLGAWTLTGMAWGNAVTPVIPGKEVTAEFTSDGRVSGTSGCNLYFAEYRVTGQSLAIGATGSTMMYCMGPEGIMEQERTYLELLEKAAFWKVRDGYLEISDATGREILVFSPGVADKSKEEEPLVEFWRTGGFAGMDDHLAIYPDGTACLTRKEYSVGFNLTEYEMETIVTLLEESEFMNLAFEYRASPGSADLFLYQICWQGRTVLMEDIVIPPTLQTLIDELTLLVVKNGPDDVIPPLAI